MQKFYKLFVKDVGMACTEFKNVSDFIHINIDFVVEYFPKDNSITVASGAIYRLWQVPGCEWNDFIPALLMLKGEDVCKDCRFGTFTKEEINSAGEGVDIVDAVNRELAEKFMLARKTIQEHLGESGVWSGRLIKELKIIFK